ncbi:hypothetical protein DMA12_48095 [Amycolatopsis balhimycina DSM 5908]|uniref:DUF2993 domain-containing protein n=1 Tax=Amycolatopsis balhimycina DSM 5908 TaxID=1081091 RepID=A0A428VUM6_AMYBA|nr:hypothetical protein DMA12_48095 [Amycolatopsis balhimycina DSM 5908]
MGGVLSSPLLAATALSPSADAAEVLGTAQDGWLEILWTALVQTETDRRGTTVEAIAPAELIQRDGRRGLRFPLRSAQGDPALANPAHAQGTAAADGGFVLREAAAEVRVTRLAGDVRDEQMSARYMVNNVDSGVRPMFTWHTAEGVLSVVPGVLGAPATLKMSNLPVRMTREMVDLVTTSMRSFGFPDITTDTVVAHVTIQGSYLSPLS